jgi:Restriction endonuclease AspBHI N-terminal/Restriction endonuclease
VSPVDQPISALRIGQVLRDARPKSVTPSHSGGFVNLYAATASGAGGFIPLESGINPIAAVKTSDGPRIPAILIASSPHKVGSATTPWHDHFDPDNGYVRYNGDNKAPGVAPESRPGNRALLAAFQVHASPEANVRREAVPLIFFRRVRHQTRVKGFVQFQGVGFIAAVELLTQVHRTAGPFANYAFDCVVISLAAEAEIFAWDWINVRRDAAASTADCLAKAPVAWRRWAEKPHEPIESVRRRVSKLQVVPAADQLPTPGSKEDGVLKQIYAFYETRPKVRFEALAELVAERVLRSAGGGYIRGGLTRASADGGIDFIGRLDVGSDFGRAKLVVLGQAKCELPGKPTSGRHIARTVARLRRGWLGVYVTTSLFSERTQREVIEDRYPIVLINGRRLAEEVLGLLVESGSLDVEAFLSSVDATYGQNIVPRDPEELLFR